MKAVVVALVIYSLALTAWTANSHISEARDTALQGGREIPVQAEPDMSALRPVLTAQRKNRIEPMSFPIAPGDYLRYTSPFGHRVSPLVGVERVHQGVDIAAVWRAEIVAIADGVVAEHWPVPGTPYPGGGVYRGHDTYGGMIEIDHGNGLRSRYAHLSYSRVHQGQRVREGEVIGRIGDTGMSDGEHLHLEVLLNGRPVNPLLYIEVGE